MFCSGMAHFTIAEMWVSGLSSCWYCSEKQVNGNHHPPSTEKWMFPLPALYLLFNTSITLWISLLPAENHGTQLFFEASLIGPSAVLEQKEVFKTKSKDI